MANVTFTPTTQIREYNVVDGGKAYEVHIDGAFWGWVAGENRSYVAMPQTSYQWLSGFKRTRAQAVEAARKAEGEQMAREIEVAMHVPTYTREVELTADNLAEHDLTGWVISGGEDLGAVRSIRLTRDGFNNAMVVGDRGRDVLGLPSKVLAYRD